MSANSSRQTFQRRPLGGAARPRRGSSRRRRLAGLAIAVAAGSLAALSPDASASVPVGVSASAGAGGGSVTATALGINTASWDGYLLDSAVPGLLRQIGTGMLRYPGGSWGDVYNWQTNTVDGQPQSADYQHFAAVAGQTGASQLLTVNYGTGTPDLAAAWVRAADAISGNTARLWEIGNENYGPWEADNHPDPHTPQSYVTYATPFITAMRQADPTTRIGIPYVLTADQAAGTGTGVPDPQGWNRTLLAGLGPSINYVDVHWYPFYGSPDLSPAQLMAPIRTIPAVMHSIRTTLDQYAQQAQVVIGEASISQTAIPQDMQPIAALNAAATTLEWLSQGASSVDWWDLHNYGSPQGDFGVLSSGTNGEPPVDTPLPSYYGYQLAALLTAPGSRVSAMPVSSDSVLAYSSARGAQRSVLLVNDNPTQSQTVSVAGLQRDGTSLRSYSYSYSAATPQVTTGTTTPTQAYNGVTLPPESILVLSPATA